MPAPAPRLTPRRAGDPVPDVLGLRLAHRVVLRDAERLAALAARLAAGAAAVDHRRAAAVERYVRDWADSVHAHHAAEDDLLWPVLVGSAGPHVDVSELRDDHAALASALERLRVAGAAFAARPDEDTATALALELAELRDALVEHVTAEEAAVLPVLQQYVSVRDWDAVERAVRSRARLSFELPRVWGVLTGQERRALARRAGPVLRLVVAVLGPGFRRRERAVFGG